MDDSHINDHHDDHDHHDDQNIDENYSIPSQQYVDSYYQSSATNSNDNDYEADEVEVGAKRAKKITIITDADIDETQADAVRKAENVSVHTGTAEGKEGKERHKKRKNGLVGVESKVLCFAYA